jgi:hypothetical protein
LGADRNERGLACVLRLEGRSVEEPDRESADRDDAEEDQGERDVRLPLGVVLGKTVHLAGAVLPKPCGAEGDRTPDLMSAIHALSQLSYSPEGSCAAARATRVRVPDPAPPVRGTYAIRNTTGASPHNRSSRYSWRSSGTNACTTTSPRSINTHRPEL